MNQQKIGSFISSLRKEKGLTQQELADKLQITDKAVSKWERGLGCPDISLLIPISDILGVTVNELLHGEKFDNHISKEIAEETLKETIQLSCDELNTSKHKNKVIKILLLIVIIICLLGTGLLAKTQYDKWKTASELQEKVDKLDNNLKALKFEKDNPLRSPNYILTIDGISYVVPEVTYMQGQDKDIYREILSYSDYENLTGIIVYYSKNKIEVHHYITTGEMINEFISISCDNKGNLLDQNSSQEQKKFYNDNKDEIKDRINQISIMWHRVYED